MHQSSYRTTSAVVTDLPSGRVIFSSVAMESSAAPQHTAPVGHQVVVEALEGSLDEGAGIAARSSFGGLQRADIGRRSNFSLS